MVTQGPPGFELETKQSRNGTVYRSGGQVATIFADRTRKMFGYVDMVTKHEVIVCKLSPITIRTKILAANDKVVER